MDMKDIDLWLMCQVPVGSGLHIFCLYSKKFALIDKIQSYDN